MEDSNDDRSCGRAYQGYDREKLRAKFEEIRDISLDLWLKLAPRAGKGLTTAQYSCEKAINELTRLDSRDAGASGETVIRIAGYTAGDAVITPPDANN